LHENQAPKTERQNIKTALLNDKERKLEPYALPVPKPVSGY